MKRLPAIGTKDRAKLEGMLRLGNPRGISKLNLREIDGADGYGTYKRDGARYAKFLGELHVWGSGDAERYWIEMPKYDELGVHLQELRQAIWDASFREIEAIIAWAIAGRSAAG